MVQQHDALDSQTDLSDDPSFGRALVERYHANYAAYESRVNAVPPVFHATLANECWAALEQNPAFLALAPVDRLSVAGPFLIRSGILYGFLLADHTAGGRSSPDGRSQKHDGKGARGKRRK